MDKQRIDILVQQLGLAESREKAQALIMAGEVTADGAVINKPGTKVPAGAHIVLKTKPRFVSRGGEKLAGALQAFPLHVADRICADVGASTGGFTDCLLQHGAARVYAIDVGYGQIAYTLRQDSRVIAIERTNARYLEVLAESVSLVVMDASFISLRLLLPVVRGWLTPQADIIALIKPQFEAGREDVGKGGVVRDPVIHARVIAEVLTAATDLRLLPQGVIRSPLLGPSGNVEFLAWFAWGSEQSAIDWESALPTLTSPS